MRINALRDLPVAEVTFDDFAVTRDGRLDYDPDLTTHIGGREWLTVYRGMAFALRLGMVMNVHLTVAWERLGIFDAPEVTRALTKLTEAMHNWCAEVRGWPHGYAYAHERSGDKGLHTHLLTTVPWVWRHEFSRWAHRYAASISRTTRYDPTAVCVRHKREGDVKQHWYWFGYLTKGAHPDLPVRDMKDRGKLHLLGDMMRLPHRPGGKVHCHKRVGVSRNLDRAAQRAFTNDGPNGFVSAYDKNASTSEELYTGECLEAFSQDQVMDEVSRIFPV